MDDVLETVEETTEDTSSVPEQTTNEPQEAPVDESIDTEEKVSPSVPYERFKEVNEKYKTLEEQVNQLIANQSNVQTPQYQEPISELDPEAARAVRHEATQIARQMIEQTKQAEFDAKHSKEFKADPLLEAAFMVEFNKARSEGRYFDRDLALEQAKSTLEARLRPAQEKAKQEGLKEGQDIAKTKQQLGAVGEPGKQPQADPNSLSAAEFAKLNNIPRQY